MTNKHETVVEQPKQIILEPGKLPDLRGAWTVGELRQMGLALAKWVDDMPVAMPVPEQEA